MRLVRLGHQAFDIRPNDIFRLVAEQVFGRPAERHDDSRVINHDHGIWDRQQDGSQNRLERIRILKVGILQAPEVRQGIRHDPSTVGAAGHLGKNRPRAET